MDNAGDDEYSSQPFLPRTSAGKRLEPTGNLILHGAGQSSDEFRNYSQVFRSTPPVIYMSYLPLKGGSIAWCFDTLEADLERHGDVYLLPQIGVAMTHDGHPEKRYEHRVAEGMYDENIELLCQRLKTLGRPAFLRLGYEFNGEWNGYVRESYRAAWIRVATAIRAHGLDDVALVWCYAPDSKSDKEFMPYYPGDQYVDWWSIDLFSTWHFDAPESVAFMDESLRRGFPVMIGESTARYVGVGRGEQDWTEWFGPYFSFIGRYPNVKAFCYINWDWAPYPKWSDWGDCRVTANPYLVSRYASVLSKPEILNGTTRDRLLPRLSRSGAGGRE